MMKPYANETLSDARENEQSEADLKIRGIFSDGIGGKERTGGLRDSGFELSSGESVGNVGDGGRNNAVRNGRTSGSDAGNDLGDDRKRSAEIIEDGFRN